MDTLHASPLDLTDVAGLAGADDARDPAATGHRGGVRRALRFLRRNLFWTFVAILVAAVVGGLAYLRTWPPMAIVQSGSMVPTINIGDVEILKHLDGPPKVGEIVVVHVPDAARARYGYPPVVSHRIVKIARNGNITTKGDALKTVDPFITQKGTVTEQVVAVIPQAGRIFGFFTSTWGMLWLAVGVLLLVGLPLMDRRREQEAQERETMVTLQTQLETLTRELAGSHTAPPHAAPNGSLESDLRALVDQAASTQQTLAGATAALQEQHDEQKRLTEKLLATPPAAATARPAVTRPNGVRPSQPAAPTTQSWSWAVIAAAAAVVGCRLGGRRQSKKPPQWWSSPPAWWTSPPPTSPTRSASGRKASRPRSRPR